MIYKRMGDRTHLGSLLPSLFLLSLHPGPFPYSSGQTNTQTKSWTIQDPRHNPCVIKFTGNIMMMSETSNGSIHHERTYQPSTMNVYHPNNSVWVTYQQPHTRDQSEFKKKCKKPNKTKNYHHRIKTTTKQKTKKNSTVLNHQNK